MVILNKIYTRNGDSGDTGILGGVRLSKGSPRIRAIGAVDETNCLLGTCRVLAQKSKRTRLVKRLELVQQELFDLGAYLALPSFDEASGTVTPPSPEWILRLEQWIDSVTTKLPPLRSFVLPGGTVLCSSLHHARAVCRRAEQEVVSLHQLEPMSASALQYLNRLSDFLFVCTREETKSSKVKELLWEPSGKRISSADRK